MTVGLLSFGRPPTEPTGRAFINGFLSNDFPFKNFFLGRGSITSGTTAYPGNLNANGVPVTTPTANIAGNFQWPTTYTGRWKVAFTGTGRFQLSFGGSANQITVHSGGAFVIGLTPSDSGTVSFNLTVSGTDPEVEFSFTGTQPSNLSWNFPNAGTYSGMDKVIVCRSSAPYANDLSDIRSEDVSLCFNQDFLDTLTEMNPRGVRCMDFCAVNNNNVRQAAYLPQTGYDTFSSSRWMPNLWGGVTTNSGNAYSLSAATDTPVSITDDETIQCQFNAAVTTMAITGAANNGSGLIRLTLADTSTLSTNQWVSVNGYNVSGGQQGGGLWKIQVIDGTHIDLLNTFGNQPSEFGSAYSSGGTLCTATLDVGTRGAKPIINEYGGTATTTIPAITANALATLVYDAVFDAYLYKSGGLTNGASVEIQVALANKLGVDMWYTIPHMMNDAGVTEIVTQIKNTLNKNLVFEFTNEVWNFIFAQTLYLWNRAWAVGIPNNNARREYGGYALRLRQVMELATAAWNGSNRTLTRIMAVQAYGNSSNNNTYRFQGSDLDAFGYDVEPERPIDYCDAISHAPYYSGALIRNFDGNWTGSTAMTTADKTAIADAADDYASGDSLRMAEALDWFDNDVRAGTCGASSTLGTNTVLYQLNNIYGPWNTLANTYDKDVIEYEGGYEGLRPSLASCATLGGALCNSATITFNIGSSPAINWAAHGNANGDKFAYTTTGTAPGGINAGTSNEYFIVNASTDAFDVATSQGGTPISLTGSPTGTATGRASRYSSATGRIEALITAYKNDDRFKQLVLDTWADFQSFDRSSYPCWYLFGGGIQWSLFVGNLYSNRWKSYDAFVEFSN